MTIATIDAPTVKKWLDANAAVLVDVREPAEYAAEHIAGSILLPLARVSSAALPSPLRQKLVIHCRKGGRGGNACEKLLKELPDAEIYNLAGGIDAWVAAGLPVQRTGRRVLPLDRQVQLTVGLCVLTSSLIGYFYAPSFILVAAFFGAGLTFAGLSGFCGLARVLAFMPWNK
jgi:rhodanese-related sulfurtransferase